MPKFREVGVDEYLGKRSMVSRDGMVYRAAKVAKTFNAEERSQVFVMTDESVDSYGDIVKAGGADLYRFEKNPIALLNHKSDLVLGTWSDVQKKPQRVEGKVTLANEGTAPHIDMAFGLMSQGILKGASIGFMPTKLEVRLDDDGNPTWSYLIHEWELYECSVVSIPANPSALARSAGNSDELAIARDYIELVLDSWVRSPEGLILPRSEYDEAYKVVVEKIAADQIAPTAWTLPAKFAGLFTADQDAELHALAASDGHEAANTKAAEFKTALEAPVDEPEEDAELVAFKAFLQNSVNDGDVLSVYFKLERLATFEKGVIVQHRDTDKLDKFEFAAAMTAEHHEAVKERLLEIDAAKAAAEPENKPETPPVSNIVLNLSTDTTEVEAAVEKVGGLFAALAAKFPMFFPKAIEERIEPTIAPPEPPAPPTDEAISAARAKAAAVRERLAGKGLIAA